MLEWWCHTHLQVSWALFSFVGSREECGRGRRVGGF